MPLPLCRCRIALDPKFGDLAVDGVGDLAEGVGTPHLRYAVRLIHGLHVHATEALPGNDGQHKVAFVLLQANTFSKCRTNTDRFAFSMAYEWGRDFHPRQNGHSPGQKCPRAPEGGCFNERRDRRSHAAANRGCLVDGRRGICVYSYSPSRKGQRAFVS